MATNIGAINQISSKQSARFIYCPKRVQMPESPLEFSNMRNWGRFFETMVKFDDCKHIILNKEYHAIIHPQLRTRHIKNMTSIYYI